MRSGAVLGVVPDAVGVEIDVGVRVCPTPVCGAGTARPRSVTRSARMVLLPIATPRTSTRSPTRTSLKPVEPTKISGAPLIVPPKPLYCVDTESVSTVT